MGREARRAQCEPRCLWECGVLPVPDDGDVPAQPPTGPTAAEPGGGYVERGRTIYTDASAIRPKDQPLRRAACAVWLGEDSEHNAAWPLLGPVQIVYRAELYMPW